MNILTPDVYKEAMRSKIPPPEKASGNLTLQQFFTLLYYILDIEKPGLVFAPAYPDYLMKGTEEYKRTMDNPTEKFRDTITYFVTREEPGAKGGNKQPFGGTREVTPRIREILEDADTSQQIYGQWFDTLVQFDAWCLTNYEAENMSLWFKRFMTQYRDYFKHMGLSEILFWWRGKDNTLRDLNDRLHSRSLVYFIRTEEISVVDLNKLKNIEVEIFARFGNKKEKL